MDSKKFFDSDASYVALTRLAFFLPLIFSGFVFISISKSEGIGPLDICGSYACWAYFVDVFSVPLSIAGLSIILGTMSLTLRRAFQGQRQIERLEDQEKLTIHLKEKEIFISEIRSAFDDSLFKILFRPYKLYDHFYPINKRDGLDKDKVELSLIAIMNCCDEIEELVVATWDANIFPRVPRGSYQKVKKAILELQEASGLEIAADIFLRAEPPQIINFTVHSFFELKANIHEVLEILEFTASFESRGSSEKIVKLVKAAKDRLIGMNEYTRDYESEYNSFNEFIRDIDRFLVSNSMFQDDAELIDTAKNRFEDVSINDLQKKRVLGVHKVLEESGRQLHPKLPLLIESICS